LFSRGHFACLYVSPWQQWNKSDKICGHIIFSVQHQQQSVVVTTQ